MNACQKNWTPKLRQHQWLIHIIPLVFKEMSEFVDELPFIQYGDVKIAVPFLGKV